MSVKQVLHMNGGLGKTSYANNSLVQRKVMTMAKPITEEAITRLYLSMDAPKALCMADLGCSSGPNTFFAAAFLVGVVDGLCRKLGHPLPEFQINLNDLNGNDFNSVFRTCLPEFRAELRNITESSDEEDPFFVSAVAGSFYGRLFRSQTLHFVHSSSSLMWLSRVPKEVGSLNKDNICVSGTSPQGVVTAYYDQFRRDFSKFLRYRSEELVSGGRMVLTLLGEKSDNSCSYDCSSYIYHLLAIALEQMVSEGLIEEEKVHSFNIPFYTPSPSQVKKEIEEEGSFTVDRLEVSEIKWAACSNAAHYSPDAAGYDVAGCIRSVAEPLIIQHFGESVIEKLFEKYEKIVSKEMAEDDESHARFINITVSATRLD